MLETKYQLFYDEIIKTISKEYVFTQKLHLLAFGTDASFYRLIPKIVIKAQNSDDVVSILKLATKYKLSVTFRAAGTSLSGQAISDSILVVTARTFNKISMSEDKSEVSLEPSVIGADANLFLAPFLKKIGPDPASINTAMIGGIAANNASGMCCGVADNSYNTLSSMKIVFYDGTLLDTSSQKSKQEFSLSHKVFLQSLDAYAKEIKADEVLKAKIIKKFKIKNTCGYSLNSFVDFDDVFEILEHLIIGSEGTLAFIKEITYKTVQDYPHKASSLVFFEDINEACKAVALLKLSSKVRVDAVELMDRKALSSVENKKGMPTYLKTLHKDVATLLIETRASNKDDLQTQIQDIKELLKTAKTIQDIEFTDKEEEYSLFWKIRKGLFPAVGAAREIGTTVIIEDIAFNIEHLAEATLKLQNLFSKYNYDEALIFGHALDGNLHFVFTQDFSNKKEIDRYKKFMDEVVALVVSYDGSLKAEHGTGRNMSPFVELEWGAQAYEMMKKVKKLFDPLNILNTGVIINDDSEAHLKNLKPMPQTHELVDKCIECGFCESVCPSNVITFTPRQRIVSNREISVLNRANKRDEALELEKEYQYAGLDTCATCSLCSTLCPVDIDTGAFTKYLREKQITSFDNKMANLITNNFSTTLKFMKVGLMAADVTHSIIGTNLMRKIPKWIPTLPKPISIDANRSSIKSQNKVVYFPSCVSRTMGGSLFDITFSLLEKAGYEVIMPKNLENLCCGMPFSSKGFSSQAKMKSRELENSLKIATQDGKYPVLCDTSPCTKKMIESFEGNLKIYEPIEFSLEFLIPKLKITKVNEPIVIHSTCSTRKMGLHSKFIKLAKLCSNEVIVPSDIKCCGFAGDRGFNFPELNKSALRTLKQQIPKGTKLAYSTSITCEIGLSEHGDIDYNSILYLVHKCSK
ncbi:FAD-binding and (Fe-S)-binding domain-containing protein [Sulfurimonas sp.]|uniref:FAD-binding and (Fe-S)-binding domain-containing protein n=1 Tax=Sulfurimonas sp. TaxID=2022749 RepID=UPI002AB226C1|nr:FAD-binding and (Fe-S)-binding domain-containing protein [Sulfurimonas sp.]